MLVCLFASDLHGQPGRYRKLFTQIEAERPAAVFLGGDLLPSPFAHWNPEKDQGDDFVPDLLAASFQRLRDRLAGSYPEVFLILGNDGGRIEEQRLIELGSQGLWHDAIGRTHLFQAAHDGPELALIRFDAEHPETASRDLL